MNRALRRVYSFMLAVAIIASVMFAEGWAVNAADYDYSAIFDAVYYSAKYADVAAAYGTDSAKLLNHFVNAGMKEGRQGCEEFNVIAYKNRYADLSKVYGDNLKMYYLHYMMVGKAEGRSGRANGQAAATTTVTDIPVDAIRHGNGYFIKNVGSNVLNWINAERTNAKVRNITWADSLETSAMNRAKELTIVFNSGRPDGTPWQTAYGNKYGDIKEMFFKLDGVATAADIEQYIAYNTDRMKYIKTDYFDKCTVAVYVENNKSYVILAFTKVPEEKK